MLIGILVCAAGLVYLAAGAAFGYWSATDGSHPAAAIAGTLSAPTGASQSGTATPGSIPISWTAPGGYSPGGYTILRCAGGSCTPSTPIASGGCAAVTVTSCTDDDGGLSPGTTYTYAVTASLGNWVSPATATFQGSTTGTAPVPLGTAASFAVLAGSTITNTGLTAINGDLGLSPGTSVTGFPPGQVSGDTHVADSIALQAKADLTAAYINAAARPVSATIPVELGGTTQTPGVYDSPAGTFGITGTLTLDAQGDPNAVFIFKAASTLITAAASNVSLVNGAKASNVFWVVGSSATLGAGSTLQGSVLALTSITVTTGTAINGRALARNGAVTLDTDLITDPQP
jgi:hypothetical protein